MHESWDEYWRQARWNEYYARGWGLDPDLARERLNFLRLEQERSMYPYDANLPDEPLFFTRECHPWNQSCQCKRCVRFHTITMQDRDFLASIGITWALKSSS